MRKLKPWHTLFAGIAIGLVATHVYHTKTAGPGTVRGQARRGG